jgi:hypothetical protein
MKRTRNELKWRTGFWSDIMENECRKSWVYVEQVFSFPF